MYITKEAVDEELAQLDKLEADIALRRKVLKLACDVVVWRPAVFHPVPHATREELEWVAYLYRCAYAARRSPKKSIAADLGVSVATAGRWIAAARAQKVLEPGFVDPRGRLR